MFLVATQQYLIISPLKAELNPICHLLALLGAHHILHVSRMRVKFLGNKFRSLDHQQVIIRPSSGHH
jgi:hypothetical protein